MVLSLGVTHEVVNQATPLENYDLYGRDPLAKEVVVKAGGDWAHPELHRLGQTLGSAEWIEKGFLANRYKPELLTFDRYGHRVDQVKFHPAYHELMDLGIQTGISAQPWNEADRPGVMVARALKHYMLTQIEAGVCCPLTMSFAAVPALSADPVLEKEWRPRLLTREYDPRFLPAAEKRGVTVGMAMTEKQGGSDVRANSTRAERTADGYELVGHKWFCSAPMSDAFLTLAQTPEGLTCFLVPRFRPDGSVNSLRVMRLKDKLGNHANASSEIEYHHTFAHLLGPPGRGVPTIIEMVNHTRLDCVIGSSGLMRAALSSAIHHSRHRSAFGARLIEQPLMQNLLADLALEWEAGLRMALRLARGYESREQQGGFVRLATAVSKFWVCKRTPKMVVEALEAHGGAGYVEEFALARIYREAPLSSIWEGSGNVICLDVLRAMAKEPGALQEFMLELEKSRGQLAPYDRCLDELKEQLAAGPSQAGARRLVECMGLLLQSRLMLDEAEASVAETFVDSRLNGGYQEFGCLPPGVDFEHLIQRAFPAS